VRPSVGSAGSSTVLAGLGAADAADGVAVAEGLVPDVFQEDVLTGLDRDFADATGVMTTSEQKEAGAPTVRAGEGHNL